MGKIRDAGNDAFRDNVAAGVPASGVHEPVKSEIRNAFGVVEDALSAVQLASAVDVKYATKALMDADTSQADGAVALVFLDSTEAFNGYYVWNDAGGAWEPWPGLDPTDAINAALAALETAKDTAIAAVEAAMEGYDIVDAGFANGRATTDENGWTLPGSYIFQAGVPGPVRREIIPGVDYSGLPGSIQIAPPDWPFTPTFLWSEDTLNGNATILANDFSATAPSANLVARPTGSLQNPASNTNPARTPAFAIGPQGAATATRFVWSSTSAAPNLLKGVFPSQSFEGNAKVKGVTAATTQNLRRGSSPSGLAAFTVDDTAYVDTGTLYTWTGDGVTNQNFSILGDGSNTPSLLIDEVQVYVQGTRPTFADELADTPFNWHLKKRHNATSRMFTTGADGIIFTGGAALGEATAAGFPGIFGVASIWCFIMQSLTNGVANASWICTNATSSSGSNDTDISPSTTSTTWSTGVTSTGELATSPVNTGVGHHCLKGAGPVIVGNVVYGGYKGSWVEDIPVNVVTGSFTGFSCRSLAIGGSAATTAPDGSVKVMVGGVGQAPTTADINKIVAKLKYDYAAYYGAGIENYVILLGDSNQAVDTAPGGPSAGMLLGVDGEFTPNLFVTNRAISSSGVADFQSRLEVGAASKSWVFSDRQVIEQALRGGRRVIIIQTISFANDLGKFTNAQRATMYADYKALWEALLAIEVDGNSPYVILLAPWDAKGATTENYNARDWVYAQLDIDVPATARLSMIDARGQSYYTLNATDYHDFATFGLHLVGGSPGNGQAKLFVQLRAAVATALAA